MWHPRSGWDPDWRRRTLLDYWPAPSRPIRPFQYEQSCDCDWDLVFKYRVSRLCKRRIVSSCLQAVARRPAFQVLCGCEARRLGGVLTLCLRQTLSRCAVSVLAYAQKLVSSMTTQSTHESQRPSILAFPPHRESSDGASDLVRCAMEMSFRLGCGFFFPLEAIREILH